MGAAHVDDLDYLTFLLVCDLNCSRSTCRFDPSDKRHVSNCSLSQTPASVLKIQILYSKKAKNGVSDKLGL